MNTSRSNLNKKRWTLVIFEDRESVDFVGFYKSYIMAWMMAKKRIHSGRAFVRIARTTGGCVRC